MSLTLEELCELVRTKRMTDRQFECYVEHEEMKYWLEEYCEL